MSSDPWTASDPQPGDFDAVLETINADYVARHRGDPTATVRVLAAIDGEDVRRLERIAEARGKTPHDLVADLLRDADLPEA